MDWLSIVSVVVNGLVLLLIGGVSWLIKTVVTLKTKLEGEDSALKLWCHEQFARRDDYIQQTALIGRKLDAVGEMTARIDERLKGGAGQ